MGLTSNAGKGAAALGVVLFGVGFLSNSTDLPVPHTPPGPYVPAPPGPDPVPTPIPNQPFATGVQQEFQRDGGTTADAAILSALFTQFSDTIAFDGQQQAPRITSQKNMGDSFARLQQYRMLQTQTSLGSRFPNFERYVSAEMGRLGLKDTGVWDERKRGDAVMLFRAVGDALRGIQ